MARERQRMERILDYQSHLEEEGKRHVGGLQARLNRARARLRSLREAYEAQARRRAEGALAQSLTLARAQAYAERLRRDLAQQEEAVQRAEASLLRWRERLTAAAQKRVATERLLQRRQEASEHRRVADEQEDLDARARLRQAQEVD